MNKIVVAVCATILVISLQCDKCSALKTSDDVKSDEGILNLNQKDTTKKQGWFLPTWTGTLGVEDDKEYLIKADGASKRVTRDTYQGQTQLYPNLPSSPYGQQPYPNYNNQNFNGYKPSNFSYNNPSGPYGPYNPQPNQWQPNGQPNGQPNYNNPYGTNTQLAQNNYTQPGYPNVNGYKPSNFSGSNPSGPYGQNLRPNQWQPNGQPNYNNPYGTNTQLVQNNYTQPGYPISNGYKPSNFSNNPSGPYGRSTPPNSWQNPYGSNNGQRPYNSSVSNPYPGYKPPNTYNNPNGQSPYNLPGQFQNNSYSGYPSYTTTTKPYSYYPSQRPPYYPGQNQANNTRPGNQHPVIYDDSTKRPGQNPYSSYNASNWSGSTLNNTRPPYNPQNGQNPQYFNSYPGSPGYGQNSTSPYNVPNQRPPYQDPNYGQHNPNNYAGPGHSSDSATFNLANGYNPSIPVRPPYGSPYGSAPYGNGSPNNFQYPNGAPHDPTRVSPHLFNSL